ncbi:DUF4350 domain-containing protein [Pleionea sediminis]|uniref:DUF4350 domain-containing protein n=1 Tax=Pleionea sediminis TaxID=2569479 RepID=UPI0011860E91|nr:DUF4350 domain-containing protein [Pleionea sediminis]
MSILSFQIRSLLLSPSTYMIFTVYAFILSVFANQFSYQFVQAQSANTQSISATAAIISPLSNLSILLTLLLIPLIHLQLKPARDRSGVERLLQTYPISKFKVWLTDLLTSIIILTILQSFLLIIQLPILFAIEVDWPVYILGFLTHYFGAISFSTSALALQQLTKSTIAALIIQYAVIFVGWGVFLIYQLNPTWTLLSTLNILNTIHLSTQGILYSAGLATIVLISVYVIYLVSTFSSKKSRIIQPIIITSLFVCTFVFLPSWLSNYDLTSNQRFSLFSPLKEQINKSSEITIETRGLDDRAKHEIDLRLVKPLSNYIDKINLTHHMNASQKESRSKLGVQITVNNTNIWLEYPFTQHPQLTLYQSLLTARDRKDSWVFFSTGHNESEIDSEENRGLKKFTNLLSEHGFRYTQTRLNSNIPDNTALIIIASSRQPWLESEQVHLLDYLQKGGNLLWLRDPEDSQFETLENYLGIQKIDGVLMDPVGYQQGTPHPAVLLVRQFEKSALTQNLNSLIALPWSTALVTKKTSNSWQTIPFIETNKQVWTEFQYEEEQLAYNANQGELQGSFKLGYSLLRKQGVKQQHVVVVGDSNFLTNNAIDNYDNKQLALNIIYRLTESNLNDFPKVDRPIDSHFSLSKKVQHLLGWILPFVFPSILLITGGAFWLRNRFV